MIDTADSKGIHDIFNISDPTHLEHIYTHITSLVNKNSINSYSKLAKSTYVADSKKNSNNFYALKVENEKDRDVTDSEEENENHPTNENRSLNNPKRAGRKPISGEKINALIDNFTEKFSMDQNLLESIRGMNIPDLTSELSSPILSIIFKKIVEENALNKHEIFQNENFNFNSNMYEDFNKKTNNFDVDKLFEGYSYSFINTDLMDKLSSLNNFELFKKIIEKIIINNIVYYLMNPEKPKPVENIDNGNIFNNTDYEKGIKNLCQTYERIKNEKDTKRDNKLLQNKTNRREDI